MINLSIWEIESFIDYDVLIIGSGICGLSTAASLLEREPKLRVGVLERGLLPSGASTKNAGFASFGSVSELAEDVRIMGAEAAFGLVEKRWKGLLKLRQRLGDSNIGFEDAGGFELLMPGDERVLDELQQVNDLLKPIFPTPAFERAADKLAAFGFAEEHAKHLLYSRYEGVIHTGKMMWALLNYVQLLGARVITGAEVLGYEEDAEGVHVKVHQPVGEPLELKCNRVAFCTNAFTPRFFPELEVVPGRGQVILTKPLKRLPFKGAFYFDGGYFYFRHFGENRVLFGGGRNHDLEGERIDTFGNTEKIVQLLERKLQEIILPGQEVEIEHRWSGIMAFGPSKMPLVKRESERVVTAARMSGIGIAMGSMIGEEVAQLLEV